MTRRLGITALVVGALLTAAPADAGPKGKQAAAEPAAAEEERHIPTMEERTVVFGEIDELYKNGQKTAVADGLLAVTEDPEHELFHAEAFARLGGVLTELDLPYAALVAYERALSIDAEGVSSVAAKAIELADKVGDTALLEPVFASNVGLDVSPATRSRMAYLAAREAHHNGNYGTALAILQLVQKDDPFFAEAKQLEGVVLSLQGRHEAALKPLLEAEEAAKAAKRPQRYLDMISLNLARAYFGAENFPRAIEFYAKVSRDSEYWPQAEFERAWSHFRIDDMNGTLGLLHDLQAPWFADYYYPEAELLRVYTLFLMCKFPDASTQINKFQADYRGHLGTLDQVAALPPVELFEQMRAHQAGEKSDLPPIITRRFATEDRFNDDLAAIESAEDEMKRLENVEANPFSLKATEWVAQRRDALMKAEGRRIKDRAEGMSIELNRMLNDSEMSKLDLLQMETRLFEQAANLGKMADARRTVDRGIRVKRGYRYWPWEGEYWADELGYYRFDARPDCPTSMQGGQGN